MTKYDVMYNMALTSTMVLWAGVFACAIVFLWLVFDSEYGVGWAIFEVVVGILLLFAAISLTSALDDIDHHRDVKNAEVAAGSIRVCGGVQIVINEPMSVEDLARWCGRYEFLNNHDPP